jgi:hypothetical protein
VIWAVWTVGLIMFAGVLTLFGDRGRIALWSLGEPFPMFAPAPVTTTTPVPADAPPPAAPAVPVPEAARRTTPRAATTTSTATTTTAPPARPAPPAAPPAPVPPPAPPRTTTTTTTQNLPTVLPGTLCNRVGAQGVAPDGRTLTCTRFGFVATWN